jgi:hypothetical protein
MDAGLIARPPWLRHLLNFALHFKRVGYIALPQRRAFA